MSSSVAVVQSHRIVCCLCYTLIAINLSIANSLCNSNSNIYSRKVSCSSYSSSPFGVTSKLHSQQQSEEYRDPVTKFLGTFITKEKVENKLSSIDWAKPKRKKVSLEQLAKALEVDLTKKEWFVNGDVEPSYFSDDFTFQDPDVKIKGIEEYAKGVNKIFSQKNARAEIIAVRNNREIADTLTVTWRLSGAVNLGPGIQIKPFVVYTDFVVSPVDGLITFQEDRFSLPGSDIVLSAFFPFLIEKFLLPPAPPADILRSEFLEKEAAENRLNKVQPEKSFFEKLNIFKK